MKNNKTHALLGFLFMLFYVLVCSSAAYFIANLIFDISSKNMSLLNSAIVSFITFFIFILISLAIFGRKGINHQRNQDALLYDVIEALENISQGNFNVFLELNENHKHNKDGKDFSDIIGSINKMAKELGTMEILRQDFISNVSHEIGSPLTSIKGFAVLLRDSKLSDKVRNHYIDIIEAETTRLSKLSDNFLKLSSLEESEITSNLTEFRLNKQLEEVVLMLEPQWKEKGQQIELKLDRIKINADKDLLSEVWINILTNSIKFTNEDGNIKVILKKEKENIVCEISDNGIGIAEKDKMHIFERFYKSDKSRTRAKGGNGLGLPLAKKIVELHNGRITVESEIGKGTKIKVCL